MTDWWYVLEIIFWGLVFFISVKNVGFFITLLIMGLAYWSYYAPESSLLIIVVLLFLYWRQVNLYKDLVEKLEKAPKQNFGDDHQTVILSNKIFGEEE